MSVQYCTFCGKNTHTRTNCPSTWSGQANRNGMRCTYCGQRDHNRAACPKTVAPHRRNPNDYIRRQ